MQFKYFFMQLSQNIPPVKTCMDINIIFVRKIRKPLRYRAIYILRYCPQIAFQKLCLDNRCQSSRLCTRPLTPSIYICTMLHLKAQKYISLSSFVKRETSNLCSLFLPSYYSHKYRNYQFVKSDVIWRPRAASNKSSQSSTQ